MAGFTPAPVTVLGERSGETYGGGSFTIQLNSVRRITDEIGVVSATLLAETTLVSVSTFRERGQDTGNDQAFSGISLTTAGDDTLYQSVRDAEGECVCSRVTNLPAGGSEGLYSYVSLPPGATTVDVTIQGVETFTGIPLS